MHLTQDANAAPWYESLLRRGPMAAVPSIMGSLRPRGSLQRQMSDLGVPTFALDANGRADYPRVITRFARWLRAMHPSIVHAHELEAVLVGLAAARLASVPITVYTAHNESELPFHGIKLVIPEVACARVLADHVIAPSRDVAEVVSRYTRLPLAKIDVVPHGFDQTTWNPNTAHGERVRAELGLSECMVIGAVGRLFALKNYPALIAGFARSCRDRPETRLMIVGDGDQSALRELANSLGVEDRVIFTGPRADIQDVFAAFDMFVHPSLAESFGLTIIESLLMGVPTLSSPVGVARDAVVSGVSGLQLAGTSASAIADGLRSMFAAQSQWPQFVQAGREIAARYSDAAMATGYEQLYRRWLGLARS